MSVASPFVQNQSLAYGKTIDEVETLCVAIRFARQISGTFKSLNKIGTSYRTFTKILTLIIIHGVNDQWNANFLSV